MTPNTKSVYHWNGETCIQLEPGLSARASKDHYALVWSDFGENWTFYTSDGRRWNRVWNTEEVPKEFRAHLLLLGVP